MHKSFEEWSKVDPAAVAADSAATVENVVEMMLSDIMTLYHICHAWHHFNDGLITQKEAETRVKKLEQRQ